MDIDISDQILDWDIMKLDEIKALAEELAREGPVLFEDELVTLRHASYQKDLRNLSFQCVIIKGKHVIEKSGS